MAGPGPISPRAPRLAAAAVSGDGLGSLLPLIPPAAAGRWGHSRSEAGGGQFFYDDRDGPP